MFDIDFSVFYTDFMKKHDLELFLQATSNVFNEIGFQIILEGFTEHVPSTELVANIGITGDIKGFLILKSDLASAQNFITGMLLNLNMHTDEKEFGQFHKEAMGEVLNQISGRSTMLLEKRGIQCDITPPTLIIGKNINSNPPDSQYSLNRYISGDFGLFNFYVGIKE